MEALSSCIGGVICGQILHNSNQAAAEAQDWVPVHAYPYIYTHTDAPNHKQINSVSSIIHIFYAINQNDQKHLTTI